MLRKKVYNTNKSQYFQILLNKKPIITLKEKKLKCKTYDKQKRNNILFKVYQKKELSLSSFSYLKGNSATHKKNIITNALEFSIESGLIKNSLY